MWQEDRLQRIRAVLASTGRVNAERIAADLGVSRETVRRDLLDLEQEGVLTRVRGGAVALGNEPEPPIAVRAKVRVREKRAIARAAALRILPGQTVFMDAGSTTSFLAEALVGQEGLMVVTNSIDVAIRLGDAACRAIGTEVHLLGGAMIGSLPATCGAATVAEIARFRADVALLSPVGLDARYGATSFDPREAEVARAMAENARHVTILADHAKIGVASRVSYRAVEGIDLLVTDEAALASPALVMLREKVGGILTI